LIFSASLKARGEIFGMVYAGRFILAR
jgi:hypothetical protein